VLVRGVVEHEIEHQADPLAAQIGGQRGELVGGAQRGVDVAVAADGVAAVAVVLRAAEQRHQVQVGQPQLFEIRDLVADARQVPGEAVHVAHAAQHALALEPAGIGLARRVEGVQVRRAGGEVLRGGDQDLLQVVEEVVALAIERVQQAEDRREMLVQPALEHGARGVVGQEGRQPRQHPAQGEPGFFLKIEHRLTHPL